LKLIRPVLHAACIDCSGRPEQAATAPTSGLQNIKTWRPADPEVVTGVLVLTIGQKHKKIEEEFYLRVATPAGLETLEAQHGILATGQILVLQRWDCEALLDWLQGTIGACQADTWDGCIERLRQHFRGQFDYLMR